MYEKTIELLKSLPRNITYADLAHKSGLNKHWIEALACGKIKNPSVQRVQKLYETLTDTKLVF